MVFPSVARGLGVPPAPTQEGWIDQLVGSFRHNQGGPGPAQIAALNEDPWFTGVTRPLHTALTTLWSTPPTSLDQDRNYFPL